MMVDYPTRYELEQLKERLSVMTQHSVAASLSAWHDKMEQSVRNVERQVFCWIVLSFSLSIYYVFIVKFE
jgi:hypothetical protein